MSAPVAVNTADGTCWTRRGETRRGEALYAPEGVCNCPPFVMATLVELAEHGIVGSADVLPVPPGPQRGVLDRARDAVDARMSKDALRHVLQNVISYAARMENRVAELEVDLAAKGQDTEAAVKGWERCRSSLKDATEEIARLESDLGGATARVAELEAAAQKIVHLHKDSPMGPCPVCIDGDAMVRGDDYTLPYPCPTARLAGAKDCDPPSQRQASHLPAEGGDVR